MASEKKDALAQIKALFKKYQPNEEEWELLKIYNMHNQEEIKNFINRIYTNENKINKIQEDINIKKEELINVQNPSKELLERLALPTNQYMTLESLENDLKKEIDALNEALKAEKAKGTTQIFSYKKFSKLVRKNLRELEDQKKAEIMLNLARNTRTMSSNEIEKEIKAKFDDFDKERLQYYDHSGEFKKILLKSADKWNSLNNKQKEVLTTNNEPYSVAVLEIPEIVEKVDAIKQAISYCEENFQDKLKAYKGVHLNDFLKNLAEEALPETAPQSVRMLDKPLFAGALKIVYQNLPSNTQTFESESDPPLNASSQPSLSNHSSKVNQNPEKHRKRGRATSEIIKQQLSGTISEVKRRFSSNLEALKRPPNIQVKKTDMTESEKKNDPSVINTKGPEENKSSNNVEAVEKTKWKRATAIKKQVNTSSAAMRGALKRSTTDIVEVVKKHADSKFKKANVSDKKTPSKSSLSSHRKFSQLTDEEKKICQNFNLSGMEWEVLKIYDINNETAIKKWRDSFKHADKDNIRQNFKEFSQYVTHAHTKNADKIVQIDREVAAKLALQFPFSNTNQETLISHLSEMIKDPNNDIKQKYAVLFNNEHKIEQNYDALKYVMANLTERIKVKAKYDIYDETLNESMLEDKIINQLEKYIIGHQYIDNARQALPACKEIVHSWFNNESTLHQNMFDSDGVIESSAVEYIKNEHPDIYKSFLENTTEKTLQFKQLLKTAYNEEKSKYLANTTEKENLYDLDTPTINNSTPVRASTQLSDTIPLDTPSNGLMMGWGKTTSKPLGFEDIATIQGCSVQKIYDFAAVNQKEFHIHEVKKLPDEGKKMTGIEIKFKSDNSQTPISAYIYDEKEQGTKFSISKNLSEELATEAILKTCRLAINAAGPHAEFKIPDNLSDEKRDMVQGCFTQAINEALQKPNSKFTEETKPKIITSTPTYSHQQQLK